MTFVVADLFYFFSQFKEYGLWHLVFFFLSYTWQSVGFYFMRFMMGVFRVFFFFPVSSSWVLTKWLHTRGNELWPLVCVCLWTEGRTLWPAYCTFFKARSAWVPPRCCHLETWSRNTRTSSTLPRSQWRSCDTRYISCLQSPSLHCCFFSSHDVHTVNVSQFYGGF